MGLFSSTTKTTVEPWAPQASQLKNAFTEAQNLYNTKKDTPFYTGDLHAGIDPLTQQGIAGVGSYAQGAGAAGANLAGSTASSLVGANGQYLGAIGGLYGAANGDVTGQNISAAGRYADNPALQAQIDSVGHDIRRNLGENIMPSIDRAATSTGNINSSRAGVAEGIAARGAQEELGREAAGMRYNAYNNGLNLAEQSRGTNLQAMGAAAGLYGNAVGQGMSGLSQSQQMTYNNLNSMVAAGQISQADAQAQMDAEFARWQGNDTRQQGLLNNYYGLVGDKNWGGTTTQTSSGNIFGKILGGISSVAGLASGAGLFGGGGGPKIGGQTGQQFADSLRF